MSSQRTKSNTSPSSSTAAAQGAAPSTRSNNTTSSTMKPSLYTNTFMVGMVLTFLNEAMGIFMMVPFLGFLIASFNNGDTNSAGYESGLIFSVYMVAQFLSAPMWGQASDHLGRKPVLVLGLVLGAFAILGFGFTTSLWWGLLFRFLHGWTGANVVVAKTMTVEGTNAHDEAKGFAVLSGSWSIGAMIAPILGGLLYDPCNASWLAWMGLTEESLFCVFPCLLPSASICAYSLTAAFLCSRFLSETHHKLRNVPEPTLGEFLTKFRAHVAGRLSRVFGGSSSPTTTSGAGESQKLSGSSESNSPTSTEMENTKKRQAQENVTAASADNQREVPNDSFVSVDGDPIPPVVGVQEEEARETFSWAKCYNNPLIRILFFNYALITVPNIVLAEVLPLYAIADRDHGGLGLTQEALAIFFSYNGGLGILTASVYAAFMRRVKGPLEVWPYLCFGWGFFGLSFPLCTYVRGSMTDGQLVFLLCVFTTPRVICSLYAFSICHTFVANAAPASVKGAVIGYSQSIAAAARALTPLVMTPLFAWSIEVPRPAPLNHWLVFVLAAVAVWIPVYTCRRLTPEMVSKKKIAAGTPKTPALAPVVTTTVTIPEDARLDKDLELELV